ncbi:porin family protein [bacterium]|nr:porin family protein [bacterium]MCI0604513.1 porin family protein [bacterium]
MKYLFLIALIIFPVIAFAEITPASGWYVRLDTGFSSARADELGTSPVFGGGLGYSYVPGLRGDLTLTYRPGFEDEFQALTTLLSLYLDLYSTARVSPYGGFGIGVSRNELQNVRTTPFAWQLCGGANVQLGNSWLLDIGYHLVKGGDLHSHEVQASLQFTF